VARLDLVNARVAARRTRLLGPAGLRDLAARSTLEARLALLRTGGWAAAVPAEGEASGLEAVEAGLRRAQQGEAGWLLGQVEGTVARGVLAAFLGLAEADALNAVLRGVAAGTALEQILAAAPATPGLDEGPLRAAAAAPSVEAVVEVLAGAGHRFAAALAAALPQRDQLGLAPLELAVERAAVAEARAATRWAGEDGRVLRAHLSDRVDVRNAALLLGLAGSGTPPGAEGLFLDGGRRLAVARLVSLAGAPVAEVLAALGPAFTGAMALATPWGAELALERAALERVRREARARPLSVAVPVAYLLERRSEARRIAVLLRGSAFELPTGQVLDLLEA
jgi:V/A-type H+/Na+-transporting ATPase subunit C